MGAFIAIPLWAHTVVYALFQHYDTILFKYYFLIGFVDFFWYHFNITMNSLNRDNYQFWVSLPYMYILVKTQGSGKIYALCRYIFVPPGISVLMPPFDTDSPFFMDQQID